LYVTIFFGAARDQQRLEAEQQPRRWNEEP
jgi:hypothetical protein